MQISWPEITASDPHIQDFQTQHDLGQGVTEMLVCFYSLKKSVFQ